MLDVASAVLGREAACASGDLCTRKRIASRYGVVEELEWEGLHRRQPVLLDRAA